MTQVVAPCPFCGSADLQLGDLMSEDEPTEAIARRVECRDCLAFGPAGRGGCWNESDREAVEEWNRCAPSPQASRDRDQRALSDALRTLEIIQTRSAEQRGRRDAEHPLLSADTMAVIARDGLDAVRIGAKPAVLRADANETTTETPTS